MTLKQINLNTDRKRILKVLNMQKEIIKAKGPYLYDANGSKYLDFTSQYGVHLFGHNPDFLWNELTKLKHESPPNMIQPLENQASNQLADLLIQITPGDMSHVTLTNSGSETVEVAIKMARSRKKKFKILSTTNSYHGKTLGAVLATGNSSYRDAFHPKDPYFQHIPFNDIDTLEEHLSSNDIAAFIVEPIQGEGGINVPADNYLKSCQELCNKYNTLFIVDEIQTGLGRTGDLFACQQQQVEPDIILLSKSLGGGLVPIGACICNKKAWTVEFGIKHSSTFSNNHITSTIALSTINHLLNNPDILLNVQKNGKYLSEQLRKLTLTYPSVFHQNSGRGLLQGIKVHPWKCEDSYFPFTMNNLGLSVPLISSFLLNQHGILTAPTLTSHHTLRLQPNLLIKQSQIERLICGLNDLGDIISKKQFSKLISTAAQIPLAPHSTKTKHTTPPTLPIKISTEKKLGTFSFFIHPTTEDDLIDGLPSNTLCPLDTDSKNKLQQWMSSLKDIQKDACPVYYLPYLPSKKGGYVDGWLISSFLTPKEMIQLPRKEKLNLLSSYIDHAKAVNADIIGLGAFTSVISRSGTLIEHCDIPITTGNSFTALTCTKSVKLTCNQLDRNLSKSSVAIVGAKGSVGRLAALDISQNCKSLFLIGNPENKNAISELQSLAGEICLFLLNKQSSTSHQGALSQLISSFSNRHDLPGSHNKSHSEESRRNFFLHITEHFYQNTGRKFPITVGTNLSELLPKCEIVISATSHGQELIKPEFLKLGAIVCDAARPSDLSKSITLNRKDLHVFEGGLVKLPSKVQFGRPNILGFKPGINLACLAETISLCMSQANKNYSIGGISSIMEAQTIFDTAIQHGFSCHIP